ncbi:MAG: hypothetical protein LUC43_06495, partial [Burkholderiales bacterium]|nr:hypothetical protein [Burkholderiales bacterium]
VKYYDYALAAAEVSQVIICPWDAATLDEKISLWKEMSPRHRDYHWRLMKPDERLAFRSKLSANDQSELKERFSTKHLDSSRSSNYSHNGATHLSEQERQLLREQVQQARQAQAAKDASGTPAADETEQLLKLRLAQLNNSAHTQILILSLEKKKAPNQNFTPIAPNSIGKSGNIIADSTNKQESLPETPARAEAHNRFD